MIESQTHGEEDETESLSLLRTASSNRLPTASPLAIDREVLRSLSTIAGDTNPTLVAEVIEIFLEITPPRMAELHRALDARDIKVLCEAAHDLRGSSGQLGATCMEQTCASIETLALAGSLGSVADLLEQLELDFGRVRNDLNLFLSTPSLVPTEAPSNGS